MVTKTITENSIKEFPPFPDRFIYSMLFYNEAKSIMDLDAQIRPEMCFGDHLNFHSVNNLCLN